MVVEAIALIAAPLSVTPNKAANTTRLCLRKNVFM
jgi:hypothetical protein